MYVSAVQCQCRHLSWLQLVSVRRRAISMRPIRICYTHGLGLICPAYHTYLRTIEQRNTELHHDVIDLLAATRDAGALPLKSSLRVNRVIMSSARFG